MMRTAGRDAQMLFSAKKRSLATKRAASKNMTARPRIELRVADINGGTRHVPSKTTIKQSVATAFAATGFVIAVLAITLSCL